MEENTKKAMSRLSNTLGELADILMEQVIEVPTANDSLRTALGEERYQQLTAKIQEADHAIAAGMAYIR